MTIPSHPETPPPNDDADAGWGDYPVDSSTRACCQGIGAHTPDCESADTVTTATTVCPEVPLPAGAYTCGDWGHDSAGNAMWREFQGTCRDVEVHYAERSYVRIQITGEQDRDGSIERYITMNGESLTATEARQLARTLMSAVDELDRLATR